MRRGRAVHARVESWVRGRLDVATVSALARPYIGSVLCWAESSGVIPDPESAERLTCHPELLYAGRSDFCVTDTSGARILVDVKPVDGIPGTVHARAHTLPDHLQLAS